MTAPRSTHRLCFHCVAVLTDDDRDHYVYLCHACVLLEHDAERRASRDPEHPDARLPFEPVVTTRA